MFCGANLRKFIGLPAMVQGKLLAGHGAGFVVRAIFSFVSCRAPDCRNPVVFKSVWLRIAAILPLPKKFGSGLLQSCRSQKCLAPDCRNPVTSKSVWLRIAAILSLPKVFGSGLLQSCRFQKCLAPDCCNLVAFKSAWLRIAAILSLPKVFGSGLPQSCRFRSGTARISGNPRKKLPEMAGALKKPFP